MYPELYIMIYRLWTSVLRQIVSNNQLKLFPMINRSYGSDIILSPFIPYGFKNNNLVAKNTLKKTLWREMGINQMTTDIKLGKWC